MSFNHRPLHNYQPLVLSPKYKDSSGLSNPARNTGWCEAAPNGVKVIDISVFDHSPLTFVENLRF